MHYLALALAALVRADELLVQSDDDRLARRIHGDDNPTTLMASSNLAALLVESKEFEQAEAVLAWHLQLCVRSARHEPALHMFSLGFRPRR